MFTFDTDFTLTGDKPEGLHPALWEAARDISEEFLHDDFITFFVPESAADLADGGPISEPVCCGGSLAAAIKDGGLCASRRDNPDGTGVWFAPVNRCGYRADALLIPETDWIPDDIRRALDAACRAGVYDA